MSKVLKFWKVQAAGNDFIMVDNREGLYTNPDELAKLLCKRRLSIGSDGLILIDNCKDYDFQMKYYNADGSGPVMCGNGGRAAIHFVYQSGICQKKEMRFYAPDGPHSGIFHDSGISLTISNLTGIKKIQTENVQGYYINTGAPHLVITTDDIKNIDIENVAPSLRKDYDANVNYIEHIKTNRWKIRTYERGVEGETYACGTGATASACVITDHLAGEFPIILDAIGGTLTINKIEKELWLHGPSTKVFEGSIMI